MRVAAATDWQEIEAQLFERGYALVPDFIDRDEAVALRSLYDDESRFRSRVVMERHAFGRGEYKYFAYPLPGAVGAMREELYAGLAPIANRWMHALGSQVTYPPALQAFLGDCFAAAQARPTALLLKYGPGDYNCLHQDIYGPIAFPFQGTVYLSRAGEEFTGGEVVLAEQRPRMQTRASVLEPAQGDVLLFTTRQRPVTGKNGTYRAIVKHGVSEVHSGERYALGLIFHDAL